MDAPEPSFPDTLPLSKVRPGENPRRYFDRQKHEELVGSIRLRGLLQPILLRPATDGDDAFVIVAGERRYKAALEAFGPEGEVPVRIRRMSDQEALEAAIDENDIREDASETEQADAAVRVLAACKDDRVEAAKRLGWSKSKLERRLALAGLDLPVKGALDERRIKLGHAELLAAVPFDKQAKALENILAFNLDVGKTRELLMRVTQTLANAIFDKGECTTCPFNSASQRALFDTHVDDGHCTNPGCFQLKTEAADAKQKETATDSGAAGGENSSAAVPSVAHPSTPDSSLGSSPGQGSASPQPAAVNAPVTAKTLAARATPLREAAWRTALARDLFSNTAHAETVIRVAALTGTLTHIRPETLTARAGALAGATFDTLTYAGKIGAIRGLSDEAAAGVLTAIATAYARDVRTFGHVADLAAAFEIDLRDSWQVDKAFLEHFNAAELKGIAQEAGLVTHMGEKPFAKLLKSAKDGIIAGMLNATGFEWAGRLPSAMTLDGKYGPAPSGPAQSKKD